MKKAIKRTFAILAAATTLLVSGAMTASAANRASRYDGHPHGQFCYKDQDGYRRCWACGETVWYKGSNKY